MKKTILYITLAAGAVGILTFSPKLMAEDSVSACDVSTGCCPAKQMSIETSTNGIPDLLKTCPVSGEKLGEMGKPVVFTYKDQEVKLCCKSCKKDFDKTPEKYMKLIRAADKK